jgi:hypothetical protein
MRYSLSAFLLGLVTLLLMGAKITTDSLKIGNKIGEDISIVFDIGNGSLNPLVRWNNATGAIQFTNDGANFFDVGSGAGGGITNYFDNSGFESGIVDGVSSTDITVQENIVTPLFGGRSLQLVTQASVGDVQLAISGIDAGVIDKRLTNLVELDLRVDNTVANGDWKICVWRTSGSPACVTELTDLDTDSETRHRVPFTPLLGETYTLKISFTDTTAGRVLDLDRAIFTPDSNSGLIDLQTSAEAYTPVLVGVGTPTGVAVQFSESGSRIFISGEFTSGTNTAVEFQLGLPTGMTVFHANSTSALNVGILYHNAVTARQKMDLLATNGDSFLNVGDTSTGSNTNVPVPKNGNAVLVDSTKMVFSAWVEITELQSNKINLLTQDYITSNAKATYTSSTALGAGVLTTLSLTDVDVSQANGISHAAGDITTDFNGFVLISMALRTATGGNDVNIELTDTSNVKIMDIGGWLGSGGVTNGRVQAMGLLPVTAGVGFRIRVFHNAGSALTSSNTSISIARFNPHGAFDVGGFAIANATAAGLVLPSSADTTQAVISGSYAPTLTPQTGMSAVTLFNSGDFTFIKVGNIVSIAGTVNLDPVNTGLGQFDMTVPTGLEGVGNIVISGGTLTHPGGNAATHTGGLRPDSSPSNGVLRLFSINTTVTNDVYSLVVQYKIPE